MSSGIYSIENTVTGKVYIGSSVNLAQRWLDHKKMLRFGRHKNAYLQASWNKYGESAFLFKILLECALFDLIVLEQEEIDKHDWNGLYNLNPKAGSRLGTSHSKATKQKIREAKLGKPSGRKGFLMSEAQKQKLRNRVYSPETRLKMSLAKIGKKRKPFTVETLQRMSQAQSGRPGPSEALRHKWSQERKGVPWNAARRLAQKERSPSLEL